MFGRFKFYDLTTSRNARGKCFGTSANVKATNETNERIAEKTNESNVSMTRETNAANIQMNAENNALQQKLQDEMNSFNYRMWQENNEYNSPEAQLARGREAGLNPNSVLGNSVAASPVQQVSLPSTNPGQATAPHVDPWTAIPARKDLMEIMSEFMGQLNGAANMQGQILENEGKSYKNAFAPAMLAAGLEGQRSQNALTKANTTKVGMDMKETMMRCQGIAQNIIQSQAEVKQIQANITGMNYDNYSKMIHAWYSPQSEKAAVDEMVSRCHVNENQARYLYTMGGVEMMKARSYVAKTNSDIKLNEANIDFIKTQDEAKKRFIAAGGSEAEVEQMNSAIRLQTFQGDKQEAENEVYKVFGKQIAQQELDEKTYNNSTIKRFLDGAESVTRSAVNTSIAYKNFVAPVGNVEINAGSSAGPNWQSTQTYGYQK